MFGNSNKNGHLFPKLVQVQKPPKSVNAARSSHRNSFVFLHHIPSKRAAKGRAAFFHQPWFQAPLQAAADPGVERAIRGNHSSSHWFGRSPTLGFSISVRLINQVWCQGLALHPKREIGPQPNILDTSTTKIVNIRFPGDNLIWKDCTESQLLSTQITQIMPALLYSGGWHRYSSDSSMPSCPTLP